MLPCILVIGEAAQAADLIMGLIFKHLEQTLATRTDCLQQIRLWFPFNRTKTLVTAVALAHTLT